MVFQAFRYIILICLFVACSTTSIKNVNAEWFEKEDLTTKAYGNRRTTTTEADFIPRTTSRKSTLPRSDAGIGTSTFRPTTFAATNLTDSMTELLKNFAKLMTDSPTKDCGSECLANVISLEMFTIAGGSHFVFPPNTDEKIESKQRKEAGGLRALWFDLFCSENVAAILSNVTRETVTRHYPSTSLTQNKMYEILEEFFDKVDKAIEEDDFLASMYTVKQIRYIVRVFNASSADKVYFSFDELRRGRVNEEMVIEWLNNVEIRKFLIHKEFLITKDKISAGEDGVAVRSILKVAREVCCIDRTQKIYTSVLDEAAKNFVFADYPQKVTKAFIEKLTRAMEADEKVNEQWTKTKKKMLDEARITKGNKGRRLSDI